MGGGPGKGNKNKRKETRGRKKKGKEKGRQEDPGAPCEPSNGYSSKRQKPEAGLPHGGKLLRGELCRGRKADRPAGTKSQCFLRFWAHLRAPDPAKGSKCQLFLSFGAICGLQRQQNKRKNMFFACFWTPLELQTEQKQRKANSSEDIQKKTKKTGTKQRKRGQENPGLARQRLGL